MILKELVTLSGVCVTEQHFVSMFLTPLGFVRKPLLFDTEKPEILGFSTAYAYINKYKTKLQANMKRRQNNVFD